MKKRLNYKTLSMALTCALIIVILINFYTIYSIQQVVQEKIAAAEENAKPILLEAIVVTNSKCKDCFDAHNLLQEIEGTKGFLVKTKQEVDFTSPNAQEIIAQFGLTKFPAIIITGELERAGRLKHLLQDFKGKEAGAAWVFAEPAPPYTDKKGIIYGKVDVTIIKDESCKECIDLSPLIAQLKAVGVVLGNVKHLSVSSAEGQKLVSAYSITKVPMLMLSHDFEEYGQLSATWNLYGQRAKDGTFLMTSVTPPYEDLATKKVHGLVALTYLTDNSCAECYNVSVHKQILTNFGMKIIAEKNRDIATEEGKKLVEQYNVSALPTVLLSPEAKEYRGFSQVWESVGTIEKDGVFVFRTMSILESGMYKDVKSGKVQKIEQQKRVTDE